MISCMSKQKKLTDVEKIINYLEQKKAKAEARVKEYQGPIMSSEMRTSAHMQVEHARLVNTVDVIDETLAVIRQFCDDAPGLKSKGNAKKRQV
jgi:ATP adenylyltransferase/5',5'''-P-1,P-4-tetraphosphate phosphorylase II